MMSEITSYLNDGANHQAQAVLAFMRYANDIILDNVSSEDYGRIYVGRYENCREQGYVFTLSIKWQQVLHIVVYEHRNSDRLCVKAFTGDFINTPRAEDIPMKDKYDLDKFFEYGQVFEAAKWIEERFKKAVDEFYENTPTK